MARHAATLLDEPMTAPILVGPQRPSSTSSALGDVQRPVSSTARSPRIALWACAVAVLVAAAGVLGGVTALHLVAPGSASTPAPALAAAPITAPAADPRPVTTATHENSVNQRSATRSGSEATGENASSSRKSESGSRSGRRTNSSGSSSSDGSSSSTRPAATKRSSGARSGDGCGPYEHKLSSGWCSPDVGVTDENGNPDPSLAVVPGNLR